jgi:FMN reductase
MHIVGLGGALDGGRATRLALQRALAAAEAAGATVQLFDLATLDLPLYVHGQAVPEAAQRWLDAVASADGLIWVTPLYHGSVSGAFKNAIDWLELLRTHPRPYLSDKAVGLICCAGGVQAMQGIHAMEPIVRSLRGVTVPFVVPIEQAWQAFGDDGQPLSERLAGQLDTLGGEVVRLGRKLQP